MKKLMYSQAHYLLKNNFRHYVQTSYPFTCLILLPVPGSPASNHLTWVVFVLMQFILHLSPEKVQTCYTVFLFIEKNIPLFQMSLKF